MFWNLFNPRRWAVSREFEVALHYLLYGAGKLVPLLKKTYKNEWSGFIDDIQKGARPYEEATVLISAFLQNSFQGLDREERNKIIASIANNNIVNPPNLLRIVGQVSYHLFLAEQDHHVRKDLWTIWLNDMSKMFAEAGELSLDHCRTYTKSH
jgi:hypothetical protein